jgi:hypothetical protein
VAGIAFALSARGGESFEREARRERLLADRQSHYQHAIAVGDIGTRGIHRDWERELTVIDPNAPFIQQEFLDFLEHGTPIAVEDQATVSGDFDHNILGFQPCHGSRNRQTLAGSIDFDRNVLLLQLLWHILHLSFLHTNISSTREITVYSILQTITEIVPPGFSVIFVCEEQEQQRRHE